MKVKDLKPNPQNPRTISDEAFGKLCESIDRDPEFMRLRPIVHDDFLILGGNQRYWAIKHLGMKEIPDEWVVEAKDLTDDQKRRFVLVDNAPEGMAGEWDIDLLANDFDLPELGDLGFNVDKLEHILSYDEDQKEHYEIKNACETGMLIAIGLCDILVSPDMEEFQTIKDVFGSSRDFPESLKEMVISKIVKVANADREENKSSAK